MANLLLRTTKAATAMAAATLTSYVATAASAIQPQLLEQQNDAWSPWELVTTQAKAAAATTAALTTTHTYSAAAAVVSSLLSDDGGGDGDVGGGGGIGDLTAIGASHTPPRPHSNAFESVSSSTPLSLLLNATAAVFANSTSTLATTLAATAATFGSMAADVGDGIGSVGGNDGAGIAVGVTETPYVPYVLRPETYIVPVLFAFIFIVGVLGNGTLIVVFLGVRQMRNVPNTYILSLALADLLVIVTTVPLTSTVYTVDSWPWGSFLCTLSEFIKDVSIGVSVFTLTALSGDRYFAIVDPLRKFHAHGGGKRATRMTIAIAVSIWLLAIICGLPALLGTYVKKVEINSSKSFSLCYPFPDQWGYEYAKAMVMLRFLVYYAIPLVIIGVFYVLIARHLMYSANVPGEMQGAVRQVRARRKVAVTVLAFVVIFGICFLPYHVFMLWFYYWPTAQDDYNSFWHVLRIVGFCLSFANSCANPVALYFVSGAFRKHFNRYLFCQGSGVRHKKRHNGDTLCMHRDTSMTSTASKRYMSSRRTCQHHLHHQSTLRSSRLQETTITTMIPNGNYNGEQQNCSDLALQSDYYHHPQHQQNQQQKQQQQQQRETMRLM